MVDVSAYNALVIFLAVDPSWNQRKLYRRRLFLEELGNALVSPAIVRRERLPRAPVAAALVREIQVAAAGPAEPEPAVIRSSGGKRGSCSLCPGQKKRTIGTCIHCGGHTCKVHQITCCKSCWKD